VQNYAGKLATVKKKLDISTTTTMTVVSK